MTEETERRVFCTLVALNALFGKDGKAGVLPPRTVVSPALMAWISKEIGEPVSASTFRRYERRALTAARIALQSLKTEN